MVSALNVVGVLGVAAGVGLFVIALLAMAAEPSSDVPMIMAACAIVLAILGGGALLIVDVVT